MYEPKTKGSVQKMLQSGPPEMTIPAVTNQLMGRFEDIMRPKNGEMSLDMKLGVGVMAFTEVSTLASAMGMIPKKLTDDQTSGLLKDTMQQYIQRGLKEKTIDPIELQLAVEPLLTPEEQMMARQSGQAMGVPGKPTGQQNMQGILEKKMGPLQVKNKQLEQSNKQMTGALQGIASQPEEGA